MGRFAESLGVGVHGSLCITLTRAELVAGDVLTGCVLLVVTSRIERAEPIQLELLGRETLEWDEIHEEKVAVITASAERDEDATPATQVLRRTIHEKEVFTIIKDLICLDVPARGYEPGHYEFPFEYQLLVRTLVPSFRFQCDELGHMRNIKAKAEYTLTARVPIRGFFTADLSHVLYPVIRADPSLQVPRQLVQSTTIPVYFCVFFKKGSCELMAALEKDVVPLGGQARVQVFIHNKSTRAIDAVHTKLKQTVVLNQFRKSRGQSEAPSVTRAIGSGRFAGVEPNTKLETTVHQQLQYGGSKASHELLPSMRSHFLSFSYDLVVTCEQAWCWEDAHVVFPLVLTTKTVCVS